MEENKRQRHLPIGYRIQNGKADIVPEEAKLVKDIFQNYLNGIASILIEQGVPNANGKLSWNHGSIGKILENRRYCGDEFYPPLISRELFEQAQDRRKEKVRQLGRKEHPNSYAGKGILNGKVFCGECGLEYRKYTKKRQKPCSLGSHESDSSSSRTGSCDLERKRNIGNT